VGKVLGVLESSDSSGHKLRLFFEQASDRVSHRIEVLDPAGCCLASIHSKEGTSAEEWPASPALQSVNLQEIRSGQPAAFLVGMSGKSHWSASVETIPNEGALVFDVACRVHEQSQWLGTKYIAEYFPHDGLTIFRHSKSGIEVAVYDPDDTCRGLALNGQQLELPCLDKGKGYPITLRWKYHIYLNISMR
jgi:hypothetical protein